MDNSPEVWDVLDATGRPTGRQVARRTDGTDPASGLGPGESHLVVMVCVFRRDAGEPQLLVQRRAATKIGWPDDWDVTAGGSVVSGETSQTGARRELCEEVGLDIDLSRIGPALTVRAPKSHYDVYLVDAPAGLDIDQLVLQPDEVAAVAWASRDDVLAMVADGRFVPAKPSLIGLLFDLYDRPGLLTSSYWAGPE